MGYTVQTNGKVRVFESHDEYIRHKRGFEQFESMEQMVQHLEERHAFYSAGWNRPFIDAYISDYCLDRIYDFVARDEIPALKAYQKKMREEAKAADEAREWRKVGTYGYADNSVEEVWEDKDGIKKTVMVVAPHGDACY